MNTSRIRKELDPLKPTYFELSAQEQLRDLLGPVSRYVVTFFAQRYPRYLLRLVRWHDELFACLMLFVERHYLIRYGASFTENFYGLRRVPNGGNQVQSTLLKVATGRGDGAQKLSRSVVNGSLFFLVVWPYLEGKLREVYEGGSVGEWWGPGGDQGQPGNGQGHPGNGQGQPGNGQGHPGNGQGLGGRERAFPRPDRPASTVSERIQRSLRSLKWLLSAMSAMSATSLTSLTRTLRSALISAYPTLNLAYTAYLLLYALRYLFDRSPFYRPWLRLMDVRLTRLTRGDYEAHERMSSELLRAPWSRDASGVRPSLLQIARNAVGSAPTAALEALKYGLPACIFFFRFLEWWYGPDGGHARVSGGAGEGRVVGLRRPPANLRPSPQAKRASSQAKRADGTHSGAEASMHGEAKESEHVQGATATQETSEEEPSNASLETRPPKNRCVVHRGPIVNATALSTGYLGCYACLHSYIDEHGTCPVTHVAVSVSQLRRIML